MPDPPTNPQAMPIDKTDARNDLADKICNICDALPYGTKLRCEVVLGALQDVMEAYSNLQEEEDYFED